MSGSGAEEGEMVHVHNRARSWDLVYEVEYSSTQIRLTEYQDRALQGRTAGQHCIHTEVS